MSLKNATFRWHFFGRSLLTALRQPRLSPDPTLGRIVLPIYPLL